MFGLKNLKFIGKLFIMCVSVIIIAIMMSGCGETYTQVENLMKISSDFVGERVVTLDLGEDFDNDAERKNTFETVVKESCPKNLSYRTEKKDGSYRCVFVLSFTSLDEYKTKVASIIGRQIAVAYGYTDTVLSKGTYYKEDYDGMELVSWLTDYLYEKDYKDIVLEMESTSNVVKYNNEVFSSKTSTLNTSTIKGEPVRSVTIDTTNHKNGAYSRTMVLSVPQSTYNKLGASLDSLMKSRVGEGAKYSGWAQSDGCMDFTVKYEQIDIERLQEYTKLFLDCYNENIYYGDQNQSSTPLAEQLVFEERINLLSLVSDTNECVQMNYNYTLPEETTHGEGVELSNGEWKTCGEWASNTYKVTDTNGVYDIRVPDGMQYTVKGINISLTAQDDDNFKRVVDFVYDRSTGEKGLDYAYNFLANKGVTVSKETTSDGIACRIIHQGNADEISTAVGDLFGSGNYFESSKHTNDMSLVTDIEVDDNINITHMLTGANTNININYTVKSEGEEYIRSVNATNRETKISVDTKMNDDHSYTSTVKGGNFSINYMATVPYYDGILLYCVICGVVILLTALTIFILLRYNHKLKLKEIKAEEQKALEKKMKSKKPKTAEQRKKEKEESEYDDFINSHYKF